jgi:hypothetical protein
MTWAEVQAFIGLTNGAIDVYIDDTIVSPAVVPGVSGVTNCFARATFQGRQVPGRVTRLLIEDGAQIKDFQSFHSVDVICASQTVHSLELTSPLFAKIEFGTIIELDASATIPAHVVNNGELEAIFVGVDSYFSNANAPSVSVSHVESGGTLVWYAFAVNQPVGTDVISGPSGAQFILIHDASITPPVQSNFSGTYVDTSIDQSLNVVYTPASSANWNSDPPNSVAAALDRIAAVLTPIP